MDPGMNITRFLVAMVDRLKYICEGERARDEILMLARQ